MPATEVAREAESAAIAPSASPRVGCSIRIGVLARAGTGNLGDEALIATVVANLRRRFPEACITGITYAPLDTAERHGIAARPMCRPEPPCPPSDTPEMVVPRRPWPPLLRWPARVLRGAWRRARQLPAELRFLRGSLAFARSTDLLVVAGSQQLNDHWGGPWRHPFVLLKWSCMARLARVPLAFMSVGAGPLHSRLGTVFVRATLALASYRSVRDPDSRECLHAIGVPGETPIIPDLVFGLEPTAAPLRCSGRRRVVGINAMPAFDPAQWPENDPVVFAGYVAALAQFADQLIVDGYDVAFFPTQVRADPGVTEKICGAMRCGTSHHVTRVSVDSVEGLTRALTRMDAVVATRYHGVLLALLLAKPVVAIAYHAKTRELMQMVGLDKYTLDIHALRVPELHECFGSLASLGWRLPQAAEQRIDELRRLVQDQYDQVIGLVAHG